MKLSEYADLDAMALAAAMRRGDYSRKEVIECAIDAIEQLNPRLNAVVMKNYENALATADSTFNGPLAGVPFLIKDVNVFTRDMPTTFSCRFFEGVDARPDSEIVRRWRDAGLAILGKTNTPEFAEDYVCEPTFRGPTLNPWDVTMTTGGSSGGAGAAVASGMVAIAHGTDLGGSIRIPAACCGVYGFKPTTGLNPVDFSHAELSSGFNSDHVLTRSVRDSAAVLDITAKPILGHRYQVTGKVPSFLECLQDPVPGLKIGVCSKTPGGEQTPPRQRDAVERVSRLLAENGHDIVEFEYPGDLDFGSWIDVLWMFDLVNEMEQRIDQVGRRPEPNELEALTHYILERIASSSAMEHYHARLNAHQNSVRMMKSMADLDLILTPSTGSDPIAVGSLDSRTEAFDYDRWSALGAAFAPFSYICNITGQPAASLPVRLADDEPPSAVQLAGHIGQDHRVLQVSAQLEQILNWQDCRPPIRVGD